MARVLLGMAVAAMAPMAALALQALETQPENRSPAATLLSGCGDVPEIVALVEDLRIRQDRIAKALQGLDARRDDIESARAALQAELQRLSAVQDRRPLSKTRVQNEIEADVDRIVALYQAMKPRDAADVIASLPEAFAAELLIRVAPDVGARIIAEVEPERAAILTTYMGARSAEKLRED